VSLGGSVGNIYPTKPQRITKVYSLSLLILIGKESMKFSLFFMPLGGSVGNIYPTKPQRITKVYSLSLLILIGKESHEI
jgi:hypothetical protein